MFLKHLSASKNVKVLGNILITKNNLWWDSQKGTFAFTTLLVLDSVFRFFLSSKFLLV